MHLTNRGLIVDFCLQDARKLHARTQKLEKHQRLAMEKKQEEKKKRREEKKNRKNQNQGTVELGKRSQPAATKQRTIDEITSVAELEALKNDSLSRGKKQRINKRIA